MRKERFLILLIVLLSLFIVRPLLIEEGSGAKILEILTIILFLSCINAISEKRRQFYISSSLLCLSVAARLLAEAHWNESRDIAFYSMHDGLSVLFYMYTSILILGYVVRGQKVTRDRIAAAICVYLLLGMVFSVGYRLMYTLDPNAFDLKDSAAATLAEERFANDFHYFSFVTLTTLGYGDITPKNPAAQSAAMLEAIIGQLYIAVLIACLVGMYIAQKVSGKG